MSAARRDRNGQHDKTCELERPAQQMVEMFHHVFMVGCGFLEIGDLGVASFVIGPGLG
jgi:hypothetical protein